MSDLQQLGRFLLIAGIVAAIAGLTLMYFNKIPFIGKLPGDLVIRKNNFTVYIPIATSIIISIIITLILYFINRRK